ncbi:hypothetical protein [Amycolatopsis sp. cmx-11-32]|uniref:hypothetical protein n=1 Tax=Amycolatopsis sp. cmx-11-32 TaxID=2785796 RepID=UPI0039E23BDA
MPEPGRHSWFAELWITGVAPVPCGTRCESPTTLLDQNRNLFRGKQMSLADTGLSASSAS